jgi:hypothetical protein
VVDSGLILEINVSIEIATTVTATKTRTLFLFIASGIIVSLLNFMALVYVPSQIRYLPV